MNPNLSRHGLLLRRLFLVGWMLSSLLSMQSARIPWASNQVKGSPEPPAPFQLVPVLSALKFQNPLDMAFEPGTEILVLAEQTGRLVSVDLTSDDPDINVALDLRDHKRNLDNILGFTFDPGFTTNRFVYVNYNLGGNLEDGSHVSRFTATKGTPLKLDPFSERTIIQWPSGGHNGCTLAFGPDGCLYVSTGDGASPDPPDGRFLTGQDNRDLLGSILRIDVRSASTLKNYTIPPDNPFIDEADFRPEIWAFGFRNPWRMSFDPKTGDLWVGDVGWEQWEMIYRIRKGGNYGWPINEGPNLNVRNDVKPGPGPILSPLKAHPHSEAASITGGVVYDGNQFGELKGAYVYGDWETGKVWAVRHEGDRLVSCDELCDTSLKIVSFCLDPKGEILVLDYNGGIYQFKRNPALKALASFPLKLSSTGLFKSIQPLVPADGVHLYKPNAAMWHDGAGAQWLLGIPGLGSMRTTGGVPNIAGATWYFPTNTVLAKTLSLPSPGAGHSARHWVETQLLHWDGQAWNAYTYKWNPSQTDADLVAKEGESVSITIRATHSKDVTQTIEWRYLSRTECLRCHNAWSGETQTMNLLQLGVSNTLSEHGGSEETEMDRLESSGLIGSGNRQARFPALANPYDASRSMETRARSWLHVNCSTCHRFGAGGGIQAQFNLEKNLNEMRVFNALPERGDFGLDQARIIAPGHPEHSVLVYRIATEGAGHMPAIGSKTTDEKGLALMMDWVRSLNPDRQGPWDISKEDENLESLLSGRLDSTSEALKVMGWVVSQSGIPGMPNSPRLRRAIAEAAMESGSYFVRDLFQHWLPQDQRKRTLGEDFDPTWILVLEGEVNRGRSVFFERAQCSNCHESEGQGRPFGPDLSGINAMDESKSELLDQILRPSARLAETYVTYTAVLKDGSEIAGFKRSTGSASDSIFIIDGLMNEHFIPKEELSDLTASAVSSMPEGLLSHLTAQEAADLLSYLQYIRSH